MLLDELLDDRLLYAPPDLEAFARALRAQLAAHEGDRERRMVLLREMHQAQVFRLLAQDLAQACSRWSGSPTTCRRSPISCSRSPSSSPGQELPRRHREGAPRFAVIAYGKLGGKELGYASDLDIVFLFDDAHADAPEVYSRLAMRLQSWITTRTSAGVLFETDLALRPSGASGLLVSCAGGVRALPGARRVGVGAPGAHPRALLRGRRATSGATSRR